MSAPETERILKETLAFIEYHRLGPGDRLPSERDLAVRLAAGRNAVREALTVLETVRIVERRPNAGFFLRSSGSQHSIEALVLSADHGIPLQPEQVADAVEMRRILEVQAVQLACERRTEADLGRLQEVLDETERELEAGRPIGDLDTRFHLAIVAAAQNELFSRVVNSLHLMSRARREVYFQDPQQGRRSHAGHLEIFAAIK